MELLRSTAVSLSAAGRVLFDRSRERKKIANDAPTAEVFGSVRSRLERAEGAPEADMSGEESEPGFGKCHEKP
jgi:hypothetical protein